MNLTATDIADALIGAPVTCELLARLLNAERDAEAGSILRQQAETVRAFKAVHAPRTEQPAQFVSSVL